LKRISSGDRNFATRVTKWCWSLCQWPCGRAGNIQFAGFRSGGAIAIWRGIAAAARSHWKDQEMTETKTYPLRLPKSLKNAVERLSKEDGTSMNQFVATAVAEKVSALQTAKFFEDRKARADFKAFDKIMKRRGGKPPSDGDELPQ
jgi:hypothetical protein